MQMNEMPDSKVRVTLLLFIIILRTLETGLFGLAVQPKRATVSTGPSCSYAGEHCTCDFTFLIVATLFARSSVRISSCISEKLVTLTNTGDGSSCRASYPPAVGQ